MSLPVLNRLMQLETRADLPDGAGGFVPGWAVVGSHWVALTRPSARLEAAQGAERAEVAWRVTLRASPPGAPSRPVPGQRLREGARLFRIETVAEADPAGRYLELLAREEVSL